MVDIFVSYARADRGRVAPLAAALAERGWSVWWDRHIPPGRTFDEVIEEALDGARAIVAVWTANGVASRWVRTEAAEGAARGNLVPIVMQAVRIPLAFRRIQAADLTDWEPGIEHAGYDELVAALDDVISTPIAPDRSPPLIVDPIEDALAAARSKASKGDWEGVINVLDSLHTETQDFADDLPEAEELLEVAHRRRDATDLYEEAEVLFAEGRWAEVVARFDRILQLDPDIEYGTELRSKAQRHLEDERRARSGHAYERAVNALDAGEWAIAVARLEQLVAEDAEYEDAQSLLERAKAAAAAEVRYRELESLAGQGRWAEVVAGMTDLAEATPEFGDPVRLLAQARDHADGVGRHTAQATIPDLAAPASVESTSQREQAPRPHASEEPGAPALTARTGAGTDVGTTGAGRDPNVWPAAVTLRSLRRRMPLWTLGALAIVSAYLPWLWADDGVLAATDVPLTVLWHDIYGRGSSWEFMLAVPILILGVVIVFASLISARNHVRRAAGVTLVVVLVLFAVAVMAAGWPLDRIVAPGLLLALAAGAAAVFPDPLLVEARGSRLPPRGSISEPRVAYVIAVGGVGMILSGLFGAWLYGDPDYNAFKFAGVGPFGMGSADHEVAWPVSIGMVIVALLVLGVVVTVFRRQSPLRAATFVGAGVLWSAAGFWGALRFDTPNMAVWLTIAGAIALLLAGPIARRVVVDASQGGT